LLPGVGTVNNLKETRPVKMDTKCTYTVIHLNAAEGVSHTLQVPRNPQSGEKNIINKHARIAWSAAAVSRSGCHH